MLKARSSRQLLLKCVLYLRWQRWSHSPGLIYLRGRIMNSLWHLIFPSLLIWLSAGIGTGIHTTWVSKLVPLHSQGPTTDLEPLTLRSVIVHGFYIHSKAPQAVKNVTHVVCDTLSQQTTQLCIFLKYTAVLHHYSNFTFAWILFVPHAMSEPAAYSHAGIVDRPFYPMRNTHTYTPTHSVNQFVAQADEVIYPVLKVAKKKGRD